MSLKTTPAEKLPINAIYSVVSPDDLGKFCLKHFKISGIKECLFWCQGINDTYRLTTENIVYMVRVYRHGWRTDSDVLFELDALNFISRVTINESYIAAPVIKKQVPNLNNQETEASNYLAHFLASEGKRLVILTKWVMGNELNVDDSVSVCLYGETLAKLHVDTNTFKSDSQRAELDIKHLLTDPADIIKLRLSSQQESIWFSNLLLDLQESLSSLSKNENTYGFCHGDFNDINVHINNGRVSLFDFDCCGIGYRLYDLATFKWSCLTNGNDIDVWTVFLDGYLKTRTLSEEELALIDKFVMVRQIWVMGLHCKTALSKGWLSPRYFKHQFSLLKQWQEKDFTSCQYNY